MRVLLIEDNRDDIELARLALGRTGREVAIDVATNGREGLARILQATIAHDLVLLDINLPIMDGFQVLEALIASPPAALQHPPVVVLSTSSRPGDFERALRLGAREAHSKFANFAQFIGLLKDLLTRYSPGTIHPGGSAA